MIVLYRQDYELNTGILDYQTSNKSFIKMAYLLKKLNIRNNDFFLYLSQPELQDINPHGEDIPTDIKLKIAYECKKNPWYYFREVIRIPGSGSIEGIPYELNRANLSMMWSFFNNIDTTLTIPRQLGKTMSIQGVISYIMFINGIYISAIMLTKDNDLRVENVKRLRDIRDNLPEYLIDKSTYRKTIDNTERIEYKPLNNNYSTLVAQSNKIAAEKKGRGSTVPIIHIDEPSYSDLIHITYPSMISAMNTAVEHAKKFNQLHGILISTTMGRLDTDEGVFVDSLIKKSFNFSETLYDLDGNADLKKIIKKNSKQQMMYCEFSYRQLGKSDEWLKETIAKLNIVDDDVIRRDYLNIPTYGTLSSPISQDLLIKIKSSVKDPVYVQYINDYQIRWYLEKAFIKSMDFMKIPIILGMDGSENIGEDYTSLVFINAINGETIGVMRCNETNIILMALFIANLLIKYSNILFVPERNSTGVTIIDLILIEFEKHNINPFTRIFNTIIQNNKAEDIPYKIQNTELTGSNRKCLGFRTTASKSIGRSFLLKTVLIKALKTLHDKINDNILVSEISSIHKKNGKIVHPDGGHDDTMFGYIMAHYALFFGKNLKFYSFLKDTNATILQAVQDKINPEDKLSQLYKGMKEELIELNEEYKNIKSDFLKIRLKIRINELEKEIPEEELLNIDKDKVLSVSQQQETKTPVIYSDLMSAINSRFLT